MSRIIIHGDIAHTPSKEKFEMFEDSYLVAEDGKVVGIYQEKPKLSLDDDYYNCKGKLVLPGLIDLHIHAPQYIYRGLGMDLELIEWLNVHTFPEESKYGDLDYAHRTYEYFAKKINKSATTRINVFATIHRKGTEVLMRELQKHKIVANVGKVNMDRNGSKTLQESSWEESLYETEKWIKDTWGKFDNITPIITPRFTPSCTDNLMRGLGELSKKYNIPVQSHLSENPNEVSWVKELCPWSSCYGETYERWGLLGGKDKQKSVMAHCVYSADSKEEMEMLKNNGTFIAHCPQSNANLSSGIAPIRYYLNEGMNVGLGSDVAGGSSNCIFRAMVDAMQASKLRWRLVDDTLEPLSTSEAFYLGTKGGGAFFGKVGSFEEGFEFDAIIVDDGEIRRPVENPLIDRIERLIYLATDKMVKHKFIAGKRVY